MEGGAEKEGPRELVVGGDFTSEQRGVPLVCPGCRGGMPEAGELCETCQYAADERLGMASS